MVLWRGDIRESEHLVRVAVWRGGRIERAAGDVDRPVYLRSSAKLLQALASAETGAVARFAMTDAELALACGSHNGEPCHTETAAALLARIGLTPAALQCGAHAPMHEPSARALAARGEEPTALHNNCSGKHSNMLAACVAAGWPVETYLEADHPLQRMNRANVAAFAGMRSEDVVVAVDGCSAPVFAIPLAAAARAVAAWADPDRASAASPAARAGAARIAAALSKHPEMIGGTKRLDTDLIRATGGRILAKMGAEGVWWYGVRGADTGVAIKCDDGSGRAPNPVGLAVLRTLGLVDDAEWAALATWHDGSLRNHRKIVVGRTTLEPPGGI